MRKLFVSLIILIIVGGVGFYFGWIQIQLPANTFGVIFTKTNGYEASVVRPGTFEWRWQRLLPTNLTLYTYTLAPQSTNVTVAGTLPSGALYSQFLEGTPAFSYKLAFSIVYMLKAEALPNLAQNEHLLPSDLPAWYADFTKRCQAQASQLISTSLGADPAASTPSGLQTALSTDLERSFPQVRVISVTADSVNLPDISLYQRAKDQYLSLIEAEQGVRRTQAVQKTTLDGEAAQKIELLKQYGELFNQYPVLLKYLDLDPSKRQNIIPGF